MRNKEEYELGDLSLALDTVVKEEVCRNGGKPPCKCWRLSPARAGLRWRKGAARA